METEAHRRLVDEVRRLNRQVRLFQALTLGLLGVAAAAVLTGMSASTSAPDEKRTATFDELTVGRINVVEPDGTMRLIISNREQFPGSYIEGKEIARPDRRTVAGLLFCNDEATECGGLIYNGSLEGERPSSGLSFTFDRFRQDQVLQLLHGEQGGRTRTGLTISDRPDPMEYSIADLMRDVDAAAALPAEEQRALLTKLRAEGRTGAPRAYLGTTAERGAALVLRDADGRPRLKLLVPAEGDPAIELLDAEGAVVRTIGLAG